MENLKDWALYYATVLGLSVFPLRPRSKQPATANGFKAATTNAKLIADWWDDHPDSNIGIATGSMSGGLVVVDLDIDEDKGINGYEVLKEWQREHGALPETWTAITGRGGYHMLYKCSSVVNSKVGVRDGVDIRGEGGYIVAPPSIHPNGSRYEWGVAPGDMPAAQADGAVFDFILPLPENWGNKKFRTPEAIPEGERNRTLFNQACSMVARGDPEEAILAAIKATNESRCFPPLDDQEVETIVKSSLKYESGTAPYKSICDGGKARPVRVHSLEMVTMDSADEKSPDWLITGYIPRYQITSLAGDGGSGKTTVWCALAAAVSSGRVPFLLSGILPPNFISHEPEMVMFFSAEDSFEYTLKRRLRKNGARLENIVSIDIADDRFQDIKFNSQFLGQLLDRYRPALCIFDPIQAFVPPDIRMGDRNAMRNCLAPLIGYGEKYGTTFLIIEHANKQSGVWGRKRIADSADIWDISRSVIMAGETSENGIRYLSHEKSNYSVTGNTVLYSIEDETAVFKGYTKKKDKDFVTESGYITRQAPQKEEAKDFILDFLKDGEKEVSELDEMANTMSISKNALKNAKTELRNEKKIKTWSVGYGGEKKFFIRLLDDVPIASFKTNE